MTNMLLLSLCPALQCGVFGFLELADFARLDSACTNAGDRAELLRTWANEWMAVENFSTLYRSVHWIAKKGMRPTNVVITDGRVLENCLTDRACRITLDRSFKMPPVELNSARIDTISIVVDSTILPPVAIAYQSIRALLDRFTSCTSLNVYDWGWHTPSDYLDWFVEFVAAYPAVRSWQWALPIFSVQYESDQASLTVKSPTWFLESELSQQSDIVLRRKNGIHPIQNYPAHPILFSDPWSAAGIRKQAPLQNMLRAGRVKRLILKTDQNRCAIPDVIRFAEELLVPMELVQSKKLGEVEFSVD